MRYFLKGTQGLEQVLALSRHNRGHHTVGVELFTCVSYVLANGVDADEQLACNLHGAKSRRKQPEDLQFPRGERKLGESARTGFIGRSLVEHVDEDDVVSVVGGD